MGLSDYLQKRDPELAEQVFLLQYLLNIILYLLYGAGSLCIKKQERSY
jgi:hypothetical protein